jgi:hypothetical protein
MTSVWTVEDAQSELSRIIDDALMVGPQKITRDGDPLVVVVASHDWDEIVSKEPEIAGSRQGNQLQMGNLRNFICG